MGIARKLARSRIVASALITAAVFATTFGVRSVGWFEELELVAFDWLLRAQPPIELEDNPVALIKLREAEIQKYGQPLCDARMAIAIEKLRALGAIGIGIDIYRDIPVPTCTGHAGDEGLSEAAPSLAEAVLRDDRVVMLAKPLEIPPIAPPQFLEGTSQIAVPDLDVDANGIVHRAFILYHHEGIPYYSLSLQLVLRYLREREIFPTNDPDQPELIRIGETAVPIFQPDDGGYHDEKSGGYQYLLDFALGPGGFPSYTLEELYTDSIPTEALRGKIVLLGTDSPSVKDHFSTPFSAGNPDDPLMLGMEIHAHAGSQLIRFAHGQSKPIRSWSQRAELGWILLWCALGGALGVWNRSGWFTAIAGFGGVLALVGASKLAIADSLWIPLVPPVLASGTAAGLVTAYRAFLERAERSEVTGLFSKFLRPEVAKAIWDQRDQFIGPDDRPVAQRIVMTSLMSDLQGYTTASESMDPEALMNWINEYMVVMANLVGDHGGVVDDYAGDGIKANFGFPIPSTGEDAIGTDARNAVTCAIAMGAAMDGLNEDWRARGLPTGRVRVGIYTGPAVVGILGGRKSMKYTTVGDTVNTAARLESFAKDDFSSQTEHSDWRILIGETTMQYLGEEVRTEDLGSHALKGKHETTRIYRVLGTS
ncbi:MAG: adenylate/guanylate cyclase domain-containing protein [Deltaproteobacteria bacterium]|jgi:adenylate cyclase|nr:adenylate/guanylate cyclase domain-containing protein [Deltaproteobacteria bacterium]